ncbi:triacylglycerol lipase, partial [Ostertagia ostertagi]
MERTARAKMHLNRKNHQQRKAIDAWTELIAFGQGSAATRTQRYSPVKNMLIIISSFGFLTTTLASLTRGSYSDEFARTKMLPLAAAAYSGQPQECLENRFTNATLSLQLSTICGPSGNNDVCSGFTAVIHSSKAIVLSFRGTTTNVQLAAEGELSVLHVKVPWLMGGEVSLYFRDAFMTLWNKGMGADFEKLTAMYPEYDVWVTGHSLGAALATLAASYIVAANHVPCSKVFVITFGQPRVGDSTFARAYEEKMGYSFRVTHWRDWVPHILAEKFFNYYHHSPE